jgi:hypothetical protein
MVQVIGKLVDLMSETISTTKYVDPRSPIVNIHINNIPIENNLVDLEVAINVMTRTTTKKINYLIFVKLLQFYN